MVGGEDKAMEFMTLRDVNEQTAAVVSKVSSLRCSSVCNRYVHNPTAGSFFFGSEMCSPTKKKRRKKKGVLERCGITAVVQVMVFSHHY